LFPIALCKEDALFLKDNSRRAPVGDVAGTIEDMRWAPDGGSLIVIGRGSRPTIARPMVRSA